ncbi:MAG: hypothetical protein ACRDL7_00535 [Gaiellaceae bacterium]
MLSDRTRGGEVQEDDSAEYTNDDRSSFLNGEASHILYYWQLLEDFSMLDNTMATLSVSVAGTGEACSVASAACPSDPRRRRQSNSSEIGISGLANVIERISEKRLKSNQTNILQMQSISTESALQKAQQTLTTAIQHKDRVMMQWVAARREFRTSRQLDKLDMEAEIIEIGKSLDMAKNHVIRLDASVRQLQRDKEVDPNLRSVVVEVEERRGQTPTSQLSDM